MSKKKAPRRQIVLRLVPDVNRAVRGAAKKEGVSINAFCEKALYRATRKYVSK